MDNGDIFDGRTAGEVEILELKKKVCEKIMNSDSFLVTTIQGQMGSVSMHNLQISMIGPILEQQRNCAMDTYGQLVAVHRAKELLK